MRRVGHFDEYTIAMNNSSDAIQLANKPSNHPSNPLISGASLHRKPIINARKQNRVCDA